MSDSDSESDEFSCCHVFFWTAAVFAFFGGVGFSDSSSSSAFLLDPAEPVFPDGCFGGSGSLVPLMVFWAKHALVLWVFRPHLLQSQLFSVRLGRLLRTLCGQYKILRGSSSRRELNLGLG